MYQTINESVLVAGVYAHHTFTPKKFKWRTRDLAIDRITLVSDIKDGGVKKRLYSVTVGKDVYRLEFNRDSEHWILNELWIE